MREVIRSVKERVITWLWPDTCPFCGRVNSRGICSRCRHASEVLRVREPRCMRCGKPVRCEEQEYCYDCMQVRHRYDRGLSLWLHRKPVSTSIYQFKYHNQRVYGSFYAKEMAVAYGRIVKRWKPDLIMPVPLHKERRRKRGYNQAAVLGRELGRILGIPVDDTSLFRRIHTDPQKALGRQDRKKNLRRAFALKEDFRPVPAVLLVDDIYTTGNTIDAVSEVLKKKGVEKVYFLTISIGQGY